MIILPVLLPFAAFLLLFAVRPIGEHRGMRGAVVLLTLLGTAALTIRQAVCGAEPLLLWELAPRMPVYFQVDGISKLFSVLTACIWLTVGVFALRYMEHEGGERRFFSVYLLVLAVLMALDHAGNLVTFYIFYELVTLTSFLLVIHSKTHEAIMAGLKYLFYSVAGAFMALFGVFFLFYTCDDLNFTPGGVLPENLMPGEQQWLLFAVALLMLGFSAKAGMFPLHGWLPAAHPVAPAPASAVLSGIITKAGVLGLVRVLYYIVGPEFVHGTWVQSGYLALTLVTVLMGSMMAYYEPVLKKRLPVTLGSFALCALALVGIPPASGFLSKWLLATGALDAGVGIFGWLGPVILLGSALLTAGYLFPVVSRGFFPGEGYESGLTCREAPVAMALTVAVLAGFAVLLGIFHTPVNRCLAGIIDTLF